ncbi:hypothetical protein [Larkinella soli]|uniref:hypothetical protein n=1 Tax=Larkinella soli TaxID=1770527 RepID=UPI000FFC324B|nr:hypothetical protein [Larkinella soli]
MENNERNVIGNHDRNSERHDQNNERFDPQARDPEYYSRDPYQHGTSDFGAPSEGVGAGQFHSVAPKDQGDEARETSADKDLHNVDHEYEGRPDSLGTTEEWDVDPNVIAKDRRDAARQPESVDSGLPSSVEGIPDNPSDEALFVRKDATFLEEGDDPGAGYDPHKVGYDDKDKE